ncbi:glycoside hydrolase family 16 protein [Marmoricola sp. OAE513]|uniref:glycoside hydrolase family 16 protein n=1 Tax=Marmoricola sp. OAE513 TaxID=2817894 RepID=UPI003399F0F9
MLRRRPGVRRGLRRFAQPDAAQGHTSVSCSFGGLTGPTKFVSGGVMSYRLFSQQFGRFEARIKNTATTAKGLQEAFWLWPDDRVKSTAVWPAAGEIDISETYSSYPKLSIPFLHYSADIFGSRYGVNTAINCAADRGVWNTYTLEWSASKIQIFVNNKLCLTNTSGDKAFLKPYIIALTQGMGAKGNEYNTATPVPATMNVDYVKVWK